MICLVSLLLVWSLQYLPLTGFLLVSDGLGTAFGGIEVCCLLNNHIREYDVYVLFYCVSVCIKSLKSLNLPLFHAMNCIVGSSNNSFATAFETEIESSISA